MNEEGALEEIQGGYQEEIICAGGRAGEQTFEGEGKAHCDYIIRMLLVWSACHQLGVAV